MITKREFGTMPDGKKITEYTLTNSSGNSVRVLDYGCTVRSICVFGTEVCLGYDTAKEYFANDAYLGAVIGRFANRIGGAKFTLNGKTYPLNHNDGENHLHGGAEGFDRRLWDAQVSGEKLVLSRLSPDMEEGYPGDLRVYVTFSLSEENALTIDYAAFCDEDTVFSPTSHIYFNLNGHDSGSAMGHLLKIDADAITPSDAHSIPDGSYLKVDGTPFDFRAAHAVSERIGEADEQLQFAAGYDQNFVLNNHGAVCQVAELTGEKSGITMQVLTDRPGLQLYSSNYLTRRAGKNGATYRERDAVCLETQGFPNATAIAHFPSPVLHAGERFTSKTVYRFLRGKTQ